MARILIIDDEKYILDYLEDLLEDEGFEIITAANGKEAIELYKKMAFDVVITDLLMPEKDGEETIIELRKIDPEVKIIVITGGGNISAEDHIQLIESLNVDHAFLKPLNQDKLLSVVKELL